MPQQKWFPMTLPKTKLLFKDKIFFTRVKIKLKGAACSYIFNFLIFIYAYESSEGSWKKINCLCEYTSITKVGKETFSMESNFVEINFDMCVCFFWCSLKNGKEVVWQKVWWRRWKIHLVDSRLDSSGARIFIDLVEGHSWE